MSKAEIKSNVHSIIKQKVALGNSAIGFKNVASDLLHATGEKPATIAKGTFLCAQTVERVLDCDERYRPQSETLERIFRYCNASVVFDTDMKIRAKFQNKPKED